MTKAALKFAEHAIYEEPLFVYPLLFYANCFVILEDQLYFYRQNPTGTIYAAMKEPETLSQHRCVQLQLLHFMQSTPYYETYKDEICVNFVHSYLSETLYFSALRSIPITMDTYRAMRETIIAEVGLPSESSWAKRYPLKQNLLNLIERESSEEELRQCIIGSIQQ